MPKLLVSDVMPGIRIPIPPLYVCEFIMAYHFVYVKKCQEYHKKMTNNVIKDIFLINLLSLCKHPKSKHIKKWNICSIIMI
jgi:hypothetical protein